MYKSLGKHVNEIKAEDVTVTFLRYSYPRELFKNLSAMGIDMEERYPGIHYAKGDVLFPIQIIVTKDLDRKKHASLRIITRKANEEDVRQFLMDTVGTEEPGDLHNIDAILQVSVSANSEVYRKVRNC